jgi:hypothetical protein
MIHGQPLSRRLALSLALLLLSWSGGQPAAQPSSPPRPPCSGEPEQAYKPHPAPTGAAPALPTPQIATRPIRAGDAYAVWGASHHLRSRVHREDVDGKKISIVGYIVRTNYESAPLCAVHRTGKADPPGCSSPLPSFSIADDKGERRTVIQVMGWASNFAQIFTLIEAIDKAPRGKGGQIRLADEFWGQDLPNPVPNVGAKVKVTGLYGVTFTKSTGGAATDPKVGIMTADKIEYLEPPPSMAYLPGMKEKKGELTAPSRTPR